MRSGNMSVMLELNTDLATQQTGLERIASVADCCAGRQNHRGSVGGMRAGVESSAGMQRLVA